MFPALIEKLMRRDDLTSREAAAAMAEVMEGRAADGADRRPSDRPGDERRAAGRDRRSGADDARARRAGVDVVPSDVFDTCGTGGDRSGTFNISSCAAIVVAACGVRVAKHGNRSVSSQSGSADVFEALGVNVTAAAGVVERCLSEAGIGFFFAPTFHPSMRHAGADARDAGRPHGVQPARSADQSGRGDTTARRRPPAGVHRAAGARAAAARLRPRLGRAWRRRHRRDLDERLHQGLGVPRRRGEHVLSAPDRRRPAEGAAGRAQRRRCATRTRRSSSAFWPASRGRRGTSCC